MLFGIMRLRWRFNMFVKVSLILPSLPSPLSLHLRCTCVSSPSLRPSGSSSSLMSWTSIPNLPLVTTAPHYRRHITTQFSPNNDTHHRDNHLVDVTFPKVVVSDALSTIRLLLLLLLLLQRGEKGKDKRIEGRRRRANGSVCR